MKYFPVTRNGYEFYFMSYQKNPMLQEIQLHMVESELVQAVGRARLVNNKCCVRVLSNFPLLGAEFVYTPAGAGEADAAGD